MDPYFFHWASELTNVVGSFPSFTWQILIWSRPSLPPVRAFSINFYSQQRRNWQFLGKLDPIWMYLMAWLKILFWTKNIPGSNSARMVAWPAFLFNEMDASYTFDVGKKKKKVCCAGGPPHHSNWQNTVKKEKKKKELISCCCWKT